MYKFSFRIRHRGCHETAFSKKFQKHHITVADIQSKNKRIKQYFYYITGNEKEFDNIIKYLKKDNAYKKAEEIERTKDTLLLLVELDQKSYIQNIIQKNNGFFIDTHTVYGGYEYWHIGIAKRENIEPMRKEISKMGNMEVLYIGKIEFAENLLSKQQRKMFKYAHEQGYYESPRKITIDKIAKALKLNHSTVGEHLLKAENKMINSMARKI